MGGDDGTGRRGEVPRCPESSEGEGCAALEPDKVRLLPLLARDRLPLVESRRRNEAASVTDSRTK